ncbi:MAG: DDE-type integrase/transposase/recombinase [Clostridium sp.]
MTACGCINIICPYPTRYSFYTILLDYSTIDTLDTTMVINACKKAFKVAKPLIINSDQGSQFTSDKYIAFICDNGIRQSSRII